MFAAVATLQVSERSETPDVIISAGLWITGQDHRTHDTRIRNQKLRFFATSSIAVTYRNE